MSRRTAARSFLSGVVVSLVIAALAPSAAALPTEFDFVTPVFGLAARGDVLLAADAGAGIIRIGADATKVAVSHPGVSDVAPVARGRMWAVTSARKDRNLWFFVRRHAKQIRVANLGKFERTVNPDEGEIDSNPFDLARLGGGQVLVADAAANALLVADRGGAVDWVATLPDEDVTTSNIKSLAGCPTPSNPDLADVCDLPATMPAEAVTTSVAVGADGAYYLTELKGFPAPTGESRIWRIEPDVRHVHCDPAVTDNGCTVVADGFTSIVDITFDSAGIAYVVELDEASWAAVEIVQDKMAGGTVNECTTSITPWTCTQRATSLTMPMAVAANSSDALFAVVSALIPGEAKVVELA
jgi:hypothetical protein